MCQLAKKAVKAVRKAFEPSPSDAVALPRAISSAPAAAAAVKAGCESCCSCCYEGGAKTLPLIPFFLSK